MSNGVFSELFPKSNQGLVLPQCLLPFKACSLVTTDWSEKVTVLYSITVEDQNYCCTQLRSWQNEVTKGKNLPFMLCQVQ